MNAVDAGGGQQGFADGGDGLVVGGAVHQVMHRIPAEAPAHAGDQQPHQQRGHRVQQWVAHQVADNAQRHHERGGRVGARVPGIGHQHAGAHAFCHRQHVAE